LYDRGADRRRKRTAPGGSAVMSAERGSAVRTPAAREKKYERRRDSTEFFRLNVHMVTLQILAGKTGFEM
jgi:hypothetical protein